MSQYSEGLCYHWGGICSKILRRYYHKQWREKNEKWILEVSQVRISIIHSLFIACVIWNFVWCFFSSVFYIQCCLSVYTLDIGNLHSFSSYKHNSKLPYFSHFFVSGFIENSSNTIFINFFCSVLYLITMFFVIK